MIRVAEPEKAIFDRAGAESGPATASWTRLQQLRCLDGNSTAPRHTERTDLPLLSLFCGPGGLDEGFRQAGFSTVLAFDSDEECVSSFRENHKGVRAFQQDLREMTVARMDELYGGPVIPVGVIGGPPCQSFSISNVHQAHDDPRHKLPEVYALLLRSLNERQPLSFFVFENVPGLSGKKHRRRYERFKSMFREAGFQITERLLDAKDYGVPQERQRIFIVGINEKLHPGTSWEHPLPEQRQRTVREAIFGLPEPVQHTGHVNGEGVPVHPNHWCMVPKSNKFRTKGLLKQGQTFGRSFRTLCWDKPSSTAAYGHREVHIHPAGHRRLSVYEAMLLQSFPKSYRLTGNISAQIRLVSEAVPPRLAWHIAVSIRRSLGI
ncbi:MAG: DNA cytosine methyltransferase [Verrucomicrobiia bacterium]